jgi:pyridoxal biosynthesis lyase PdxS
MKKDDALDKLERAGNTIHGVNASAWNTALNPTQYGILSIATIPVLSAASIGHLVSHAVVRQINPDTFEKITGLGGKPTDTP